VQVINLIFPHSILRWWLPSSAPKIKKIFETFQLSPTSEASNEFPIEVSDFTTTQSNSSEDEIDSENGADSAEEH